MPPLLPGQILITAPLDFSGQLSAFVDPSRTGAPLFSTTLVGSGQARLSLREHNPGLQFVALEFVFGPSAAPVPEPATFALLATGLAAAIVRQRRSA
jgi:hypothetical protein